MSRMTGAVPVTGDLVPVLVTFTDLSDPATARAVPPDDMEAALGKGFRLHGISAEAVPNGFWPLDFGGPLGEPVTRGSRPNCRGGIVRIIPRRLRFGRRHCRSARPSTPSRHSREITMQARAGAPDIDPAPAGRHDLPDIAT